MTRILLINPNTTQATTDMMVGIARSVVPPHMQVSGATAGRGVPMILDPPALAAAAAEVLEIGLRLGDSADAVIVSAFGDPGVTGLRGLLDQPVVGIAEAAMLEAAWNGRRFGIATITPGLVATIDGHAAALGLGQGYTGTRLAPGDATALAADPGRLVDALHQAVARCIRQDGAEAVVIGGGPLGDAASVLAPRFEVPVIAPIPAAVRRVVDLLATRHAPS